MKPKGKLTDTEKDVRMNVLQELKDMLEANPIPMDSGKKKVTVIAKDDKDLDKGLSKAKELVDGGMDDMDRMPDEMDEESKLEMLKAMLKKQKS